MEPTAAERAIEYYRRRLDELVLESCERVRAADLPFYRALPLPVMQASVKRVFEAVAADLESDAPQAYPAILSALGVQRASMGVSVTEITAGMHFGFEVVSEAFAVDFAADPDPILFWERKRGRIAYAGVAALADAYLVAREKLIRTQADEILALSTQVLPLYPGVLVCPLIGHLDHERAQAMTTAVLAAVVRHRSRVVVFDLSGVPLVDAGMASHLVGAARAVGLLGARPLLVGLGPGVAQAIVAVGLDLGQIPTLGDLAGGLAHALAVLGKTIVDA
ncbi:rsbT co-antagonist protein RsbR [Nannocystis exedens]|uniref:RsbT co-antagonist protein RsbR n=1 Tax=Nannocystis exedens TaxID=54 RepID=A0A1I1ZSH1_9BACT|nr:STAS domain-containing protein [Nannocystis exedens]PCC75384.1 sigma-B modulator protein [Nannocystis exedens]SFE33583.1 rsbT co-antagonist protein RsbR [Nannocystis exedens]